MTFASRRRRGLVMLVGWCISVTGRPPEERLGQASAQLGRGEDLALGAPGQRPPLDLAEVRDLQADHQRAARPLLGRLARVPGLLAGVPRRLAREPEADPVPLAVAAAHRREG